MKILHIAAHLGGGVGKAHAALCAATDAGIERHYALLEAPRDRRFADAIVASGAGLTVGPDATALATLAEAADIVQIEWWNHPRLYQTLCRTSWPAMRSLAWCHISGLFPPLIPDALIGGLDRIAFTSACSLEADGIGLLPAEARARLVAINSGFGFAAPGDDPAAANAPIGVLSLGTLDFAKMSRDVFDVIDAARDPSLRVAFWGTVEPEGEVLRAARAMAHPDRVSFMGHAADPERVMSAGGIFLYLLQPRHYGTGENGLVEAMSLGLVPLAFDNPAERAIIEHGATGFLEQDSASAARRLEWMLSHPQELDALGRRAMQAARRKTPETSAAQFADLYAGLMLENKREVRFPDLLGDNGARWFLSTQTREIVADRDLVNRLGAFSASGTEAKGTLAHFRGALPGDPSLDRI